MKLDRTRRLAPHLRLPVLHAWYLTYQASLEYRTVGEVASRLLEEKIGEELAKLSELERRLIERGIPGWMVYDKYTEVEEDDASTSPSKGVA